MAQFSFRSLFNWLKSVNFYIFLIFICFSCFVQAGPLYQGLDAFESNDLVGARTHFKVLEEQGSVLASAYLASINKELKEIEVQRFDPKVLSADQRLWLDASEAIRMYQNKPSNGKKKVLMRQLRGYSEQNCGHAHWFLGKLMEEDNESCVVVSKVYLRAIQGGDFRASLDLQRTCPDFNNSPVTSMKPELIQVLKFINKNFSVHLKKHREAKLLGIMESHMKPEGKFYSDHFSPAYLMMGSMVGIAQRSWDNARSLHNDGKGDKWQLELAGQYAHLAVAQGEPRAFIVLAALAYAQKNYALTYDYYKKANERGVPNTLKGMATSLYNMGKYDEAKKLFEGLLEQEDMEGHMYLADYYFTHLKDYAQAENSLKQALDAGFKNMDVMFKYGYVCSLLKRDAEAVSWYEKAAALGDKRACFNLGVGYYFQGELDQALSYFKQAKNLGATHVGRDIARIYVDKGEYAKAEQELLAIYKPAEKNGEIAFALGAVYLKMQKWKECLEYSRKGVFWGNFHAITNLGNAYRALEKPELAKVYYHRALEQGDSMAALNLAQMYVEKQEAQKALELILPFMHKGDKDALAFYCALKVTYPQLFMEEQKEEIIEIAPDYWASDSEAGDAAASSETISASSRTSEEEETDEVKFQAELLEYERENERRYNEFRKKRGKAQQAQSLGVYEVALNSGPLPQQVVEQKLDHRDLEFIQAVYGKEGKKIISYRMDEVRQHLINISRSMPQLHLEECKSDNHALKIIGFDGQGYKHMLTLHAVHGTHDSKLYRALGLRIRAFLTQLNIKP